MKKRLLVVFSLVVAMGLPLVLPMSSEASALTTESAVEKTETVDLPTEEALDESSQLVVPGLGSWLYEKNDTAKIVYLVKYTGKDERIKVPATYTINGQSYAVELKPRNPRWSMYDGVFSGVSKVPEIKEVEFEDGVGGDFRWLFSYCRYLKKANIPSKATSCENMFYQCSNLIEVSGTIPVGVTDCSGMFAGCTGLTKAPEIPSGVTDCSDMFADCTSLTEASEIPMGVKKCYEMFLGCTGLTKAPEIPSGVTNCISMFRGCSKLAGDMKIMGSINDVGKDNSRVFGMFYDAATEGSSLTIYYADGVNIDEILATKSANSKITAKPLSGNPAPAPVNPTPSSPSGTKVATYNGDTFYQGSDGNLRCYDKNNQLVTNEFKCDGTYTYYMQADGTPMKDRLTYHPDGEHIIYLDTEGHEVFTNFQYCPSVGYICYFDSQGYLYKDQITFVGDKTYYLNGNGAMEQSGWFQFANGLDYGYANGDGTLVTTGFSCDPYGRTVFYHWNGMVARGLISDGVYYYNMDTTDGHYLGQFPVQ